jgi:DNA-binding LacI/PurR family transcriptional regulator
MVGNMATIKEIAEKTGFSLSTVSIVLSGNGDERHISVQTQTKVLKVARDMGYAPNVSARRLRSSAGIKRLIVIYWASDYRAALVFRFLQGVHRYMRRKNAGYEVIIHPFKPGTLSDLLSPAKLSAYSAGIICTADEEDISYLERIKVFTPIVLYNRHSKKYSSVITDNTEVGSAAARILWDRGKRSALAVCASRHLSFVNERIEAFITAFCRLGGVTEKLNVPDNTIASAYAGVLDYDFQGKSGLGIFCTTDILSMGIMKRLNELGIGGEVHIVYISMLNKEVSSFALPDCSILEIPIEKMGYRCLETIDRIFNGEIVEPCAVKVKFAGSGIVPHVPPLP